MIVSNNTAYSFFVVNHSVRMIFFSSSSKLIIFIKIIIMTRTTVLESNEIADDNIYLPSSIVYQAWSPIGSVTLGLSGGT